MKVADDAKMEETGTEDGTYSPEDMDCMLDHFIKAKQIEADPQKLAMLKNYAMSKQKVITDLFDVNKLAPPKSLKDLKKIYNQKVQEDDSGD